MVILVDFGSQTSHLIARRITEIGSAVSIVHPENLLSEVRKKKPKGIIFSGGPASVYEQTSPSVEREVFTYRIPILGICYGLQLITHLLEGRVNPGVKKEFGPSDIKIHGNSNLFTSLPNQFRVWMSHGDRVERLPVGFQTFAKSSNSPYAAISNEKKKIYGIQFHPEVIHTEFGEQILANFLKICNISLKELSITGKQVNNLIQDIRDSVGNQKAICALSGGVDSSVAAIITHKALGKKLTCIYIDSGLMRKNETKKLNKVFRNKFHVNVKIIRARNVFLKNLEAVSDPEKKRKIIGRTFIKILEKEAKKQKARFLVQGTIYPDVIESAGTKHSKKIKTHHNVGGLPKKMSLILIEPLRNFYKDQVRKIGKILKLPNEIVHRQPFPGPGMAVRIVGSLTNKKLRLLREADEIIQEEVVKTPTLEKKLWQIFAVYPGVRTTGVRGDNRAYGETIAIRAVEAKDAMTAHFAKLPYSLLDTISSRIVNEIKEVNRVVYDITNKPPATIEWE